MLNIIFQGASVFHCFGKINFATLNLEKMSCYVANIFFTVKMSCFVLTHFITYNRKKSSGSE